MQLTKHFMEVNELQSINSYKTDEVDPISLLTPFRFDLMAKYLLGYSILNNYKISFAKEIYSEHIKIFSKGTFIEGDGLGKNTIDKYVSSFEDTIRSIKKDGFSKDKSLIPVSDSGTILDGAHRTIISILLNEKVTTVTIPDVNVNYNYEYFKNNGLDAKYLDYMAYQYCKLKSNVYVACIWPSAEGKDNEVCSIINEFANIIYRKNVHLNSQGQINLLSQIYSSHDWIGSVKDNFSGVNSKASKCFSTDKPIRIFAFEAESLDVVLQLKEKVRNLFAIENHSIHITDNSKESIQMAELLFNQNSISFLNFGDPTKYKKFYSLVTEYKSRILNLNNDSEKYIIDTSGVLGIYGLRMPEDLDFLSVDNNYQLIESDLIDEHASELKYHQKSKFELIYSPENYFYYNDLKFLSLQQLKKMKSNRNEIKDREDIVLFSHILEDKNKQTIRRLIILCKRKIRWVHLKYRSKMVKLLKMLKLYEIIRKLVKG